MARIIKVLIIFLVLTNTVSAAEIIKAEPILNTKPVTNVVRPQIVAPPSKPVQITPNVNYVPKTTTTTTSVVKNANFQISAHQTTNTPVANPQPTAVQPQLISFQKCTKIFPTDSERLFYLAVASVNANNFKIDEIQSKSGYILFSVVKKQFLLSTAIVDKKNSIIKITPVNNNYYFPEGIVTNIFKYIDLNIDTPVTKM